MNIAQAQLKIQQLEKQVLALKSHISSLEDVKLPAKENDIKILIKQKERADSKLSKQANNFAFMKALFQEKIDDFKKVQKENQKIAAELISSKQQLEEMKKEQEKASAAEAQLRKELNFSLNANKCLRSGMTTIQDSFQISNKAVKTLQQENLKLNEEKESDQEKIRILEEKLSKLQLEALMPRNMPVASCSSTTMGDPLSSITRRAASLEISSSSRPRLRKEVGNYSDLHDGRERPYCCGTCGKKFGTERYLNAHKTRMHKKNG